MNSQDLHPEQYARLPEQERRRDSAGNLLPAEPAWTAGGGLEALWYQGGAVRGGRGRVWVDGDLSAGWWRLSSRRTCQDVAKG